VSGLTQPWGRLEPCHFGEDETGASFDDEAHAARGTAVGSPAGMIGSGKLLVGLSGGELAGAGGRIGGRT
jgi:hypothetical protein